MPGEWRKTPSLFFQVEQFYFTTVKTEIYSLDFIFSRAIFFLETFLTSTSSSPRGTTCSRSAKIISMWHGELMYAATKIGEIKFKVIIIDQKPADFLLHLDYPGCQRGERREITLQEKKILFSGIFIFSKGVWSQDTFGRLAVSFLH